LQPHLSENPITTRPLVPRSSFFCGSFSRRRIQTLHGTALNIHRLRVFLKAKTNTQRLLVRTPQSPTPSMCCYSIIHKEERVFSSRSWLFLPFVVPKLKLWSGVLFNYQGVGRVHAQHGDHNRQCNDFDFLPLFLLCLSS